MERDPFRYFRLEARELLDGMAAALLELARGPAPDAARRALRTTHTLKGAAGVVRLPEIAGRAHDIEETLAPHVASERMPAAAIDHALALLAEIEHALALLPAHGADKVAELPARDADQDPGPRAPAPLDSVRAPLAELDRLAEGLAELELAVLELRGSEAGLASAGAQALALATALASSPHQAAAERLAATLAELRHALDGTTLSVERESAAAASRAGRIRLVPANALFGELQRVARDAARVAGLEVELLARGGHERLDAHVLGVLRGALAHLVRNAVVHGIEPAAARVAMGKPPAGRVELAVERKGDRVIVRCADDGRGLDVAAVRAAASARGRLAPDEVATIDDARALELLFGSGYITTRRHADLMSGRGIGLDAVRDAVARLDGRIRATSRRGHGLVVELEVPIVRSAMPLLVLEDGDAVAALPLGNVRRAVRARPGDIAQTASGRALALPDGPVPFASLASLLGRAEPHRDTWTVAIVEAEGRRAAVGAGSIAGARTATVLPIPAIAGSLPLLAGAMQGAYPRPVLDPHATVEAIHAGRGRSAPDRPPRLPPVLVIDDSLTTRMLEQGILEANGYEVDLATSAEEGLERALARSYGLFLVDVEMPNMNGFEFVARTRADPRLADVPAVLVTTRGAPEDRRRGLECGARAYIVKSEFDEARLLSTIKSLMG